MDWPVKSQFIPESTMNNNNSVVTADELAIKQLAQATNLQLTVQELKILKQCQHDAITQRGLPAAAVSCGGVYYFTKYGKNRKTNLLLLAGSSVLGFLFGTMSYRSICTEKLLALPESTLKERILEAQGKQPQVKIELPNQDGGSWFDSVIPGGGDVMSMESSLNVETHQSYEFNDISRNDIDRDNHYNIDPPLPATASSFTTYDELRQKNRQQYIQSQNKQLSNRNVREVPSDVSLKEQQPYPSDPYYDLSQRATSDDFLR